MVASQQLVDPGAMFKWGIYILLTTMALRTGVEYSKWSAEHKRSWGRGLADSLPIKAHPVGDYVFARIVTRSSASNGTYFEVEETATINSSGFVPGCPGSPPPHILRKQDRVLTVLEGTLMYSVNGEEGRAQEGDVVVIPRKQVAIWWVGESPENKTVIRIKTEPAGEYAEQVYESLSGFTRDHGSSATTPYMQMMIWAARQDMDLAFLPKWMRLASRFVGAPLAKIIGYEVTYPRYTTIA